MCSTFDKFTKGMLKTGLVVQTREENYYLVLVTEDETLFVRECGYMSANQYDDNLICTAWNHDEYDIMKVIDPITITKLQPEALVTGIRDYDVLWECNDEVVMTIAEIEKKLGIKNLRIAEDEEVNNNEQQDNQSSS